MKKLLFVILYFFLQINFILAQEYVELEPADKKQAVILISGKDIVYYKLNKKEAIQYSVEGLDKIYVYTRKQIDFKDKPDSYEVNYYFDKGEEKSYVSGKIKTDSKAVYLDRSLKRRPSMYYRKVIPVPKNAKKLNIILNKSNDNVDINILANYGSKRKKVKPLGDFEETTIKTGERLKYYKLNSVIPMVIKAEGSGKIIMYSRLRMSDKSKGEYSISMKDNNANRKVYRFDNSEKSKETAYKSFSISEFPSKYHKTIIDIPAGYGEILFSSDDPVDARFVFKKDTKRRVYKNISSTNDCENIYLEYKQSKTNRKYCRISNEKSYDFKIKGPQKIRILSRGEFQFDMHSNNDYELIVKMDGQIQNTYKLSCFRSSEVEYKDNDEMIPGTLDRVYIHVPKGEHTYSISVNNNKKTALIRVSKEAE